MVFGIRTIKERAKAALFERWLKYMQYVYQLSDAYASFLMSQIGITFLCLVYEEIGIIFVNLLLFFVYGHQGQLRFCY